MVYKGTQSVVEFKDNTIAIDIDTDRVTESDGWKLRPLNQCLVCLYTPLCCTVFEILYIQIL